MENVIRNFDTPDEVRTFEKGKFELLRIGGKQYGRATYEPGWRWSEHVGPETGARWCEVDHVGVVLQGRAKVKYRDGEELVIRAGDVFVLGPGHDSWVEGDEPYVSLHLGGADEYAR